MDEGAHTLVDIGAVRLLAGLCALLLVACRCGCLLASLLLLSWGFAGGRLATGGGGLRVQKSASDAG